MLIKGVIDYLFDEEDGWVLVDFKIDAYEDEHEYIIGQLQRQDVQQGKYHRYREAFMQVGYLQRHRSFDRRQHHFVKEIMIDHLRRSRLTYDIHTILPYTMRVLNSLTKYLAANDYDFDYDYEFDDEVIRNEISKYRMPLLN